MPLSHLEILLRQNKKSLVLPEGADPRTWKAIDHLLQEDLVAKIWVLGNADEVRRLQGQSRSPNDSRVFLACDRISDISLQTRAELIHHAESRGKTLDQDVAANLAEHPLYQGAWLVKAGHADAGLAGAVYSTAEVIRAGLAVIGLQEGIRSISSSFLMHRPGSHPLLWLYTDCGVIIEPTAEQLADTAATSLETWKRISKDEPIVAFLSYSTKGSAKHASQAKVVSGFEIFRERYPDVLADGELQFDAAFDATVGLRKAPGSKVAGRANIFVFPNLDAGNIAYKITQRLGGFEAWGPLLQGFRKPWSDLSRGASPADIAACAVINLSKSF
ncbi:MAG: phosphate acyltransferase [Pseudomonadota bacterium]